MTQQMPRTQDEYRIAWERLRASERDCEPLEKPMGLERVCQLSLQKIRAAFDGRRQLTEEDIAKRAKLKLAHVEVVMEQLKTCNAAFYEALRGKDNSTTRIWSLRKAARSSE